VKDSNLRPTA